MGFPKHFSPELAFLSDKIPTDDDWLHEIKFDGYRIIIFIQHKKVRFLTRRGHDWTHKFASLEKEMSTIPVDNAILDGELIALNKSGVSDFQTLQNLIGEESVKTTIKKTGENTLQFYLFDLPYYNGQNLANMALIERKMCLMLIFKKWKNSDHPHILYSEHVRGHGEEVLKAACEQGLEGIISKKMDSHYIQKRSHDWLKSKCIKRQEFVIGGYTAPGGSRQYFGSLLLGYYNKQQELIYSGNVGTGFNQRSLQAIYSKLKALQAKKSAFKSLPKGSRFKKAFWVKPKLVAEVQFLEWTNEGALRHPSFIALRLDKKPIEINKEKAVALPKKIKDKKGQENPKGIKRVKKNEAGRSTLNDSLELAGVSFSHPSQLLGPTKLSKAALAEYYFKITDYILPYITERPIVLVRCTGKPLLKARAGLKKPPISSPGAIGCFYQKHYSKSFPKSIKAILIKEKQRGAKGENDVSKKRSHQKEGMKQNKSTKAKENLVDVGNISKDYFYIQDQSGLLSLIQLDTVEIHPWASAKKSLEKPDQITLDLDPGPGLPWKKLIAATLHIRDELSKMGLKSFVKTSGGKGIHVVIPIATKYSWVKVKSFAEKMARTLAEKDPLLFTATVTKSHRQGKIFVDYLRNSRGSLTVAPYSVRTKEHGPISMPISWEELSTLKSADQFTVSNVWRYLAKRKKDPWADFYKCQQLLP